MRTALLLYHGCLKITGGAQRVVYNLATFYKSYGFKTIVVHNCNKFNIEHSDGITFVSLPLIGFPGYGLLASPAVLQRILRLVDSSNLVHLFYSETPLQLVIALYARLRRKKVVSTHLAFITYINHFKLVYRLLSPIIIATKILIALLSDKIHTPLFQEKHVIAKLPLLDKEKIVVIPHSIPAIDAKTRCKNNPDSNDKLRIVFLGRFSKEKGAQILLHALYTLQKRRNKRGHNDIELIIIGPRYYVIKEITSFLRSKECKRDPYTCLQLIKSRIRITGFVDESKKRKIIQNIHCGIIPSIADPVEAFSITMSEFNALGKCIIAANIGALKYRASKKHGVAVTFPPNPSALAIILDKMTRYREKLSHYCPPLLDDVIDYESERKLWGRVIKELLGVDEHGSEPA